MMPNRGHFFPWWNRSFAFKTGVLEGCCVVAELDWNTGDGFRDMCEFWCAQKRQETVFFLSFCRDLSGAQ